MAARVVDLCEAIKTYIESQTYSFTFTVARTNWVTTDLKDSAFTRVFVYPAQPTGSSTEIGSRGDYLRRYSVNVHLTNYVDSNSQSEIDTALQLAEEIEQSLENVDHSGFQMVRFTSQTAGRPYFELEAAVERNYYHSIITIEYLGTL